MFTNPTDLTQKRCEPCEGNLPPLSAEQVRDYLTAMPHWMLTDDGMRIRREWQVQDFAVALDFFQRVGRLAEDEGHHPDLHLTAYRHVAIEIWTHALGGLSENDFILAAKIDQLGVAEKR